MLLTARRRWLRRWLRRLPDDLAGLVLEHEAALVLQRRWRLHTLCGHARRPAWPAVRAHLRDVGVWRALAPYAAVRREWRCEAESWLCVDASEADVLVREARRGLWGPRRFPPS